MDLETENRIAAILLKEAAELRRQAQREGALAYLRQPTARSRPNSRFLTATVRGVQQANRVVEVNEMWRLREKQIELDNRLSGARNESNTNRNCKVTSEFSRRSRSSSSCNEPESCRIATLSSKKRDIQNLDPTEDEGLRDDEVDEFLNSRAKRGRGAVGSRMDETGPYLPSCPVSKPSFSESSIEEKKKVLLGPLKPHQLKSVESSDDESDEDRRRKAKRGSDKGHSKKHKSKDKSRDKKKKKRKDKKHKYH
ncbi:phytochrome interacting factor 3-like 2 [Striga asiatica]|uniref:Phytochrome interacting factor 3-like 2 n=1 Tax=Striga asiatica TaxID=4170 RepID=A0A5A7QB00_STRAF|nr:phytochrome interacting factor 3-like 2 [Striga asiatica]